MIVLQILLAFTIAIIACSIILPFVVIPHKLLRRLIKIAIVVILILLCVLHVQIKYKIEPYVPDYNPSVYITDHGDKYHTKSCGYLWNSSNSISLYSATMNGYYPCSRCDPPVYAEDAMLEISASLKSQIPDPLSFVESQQFIFSLLITASLLAAANFFAQRIAFFTDSSKPNRVKVKKFLDYLTVLFIAFYLPGAILLSTMNIVASIAILIAAELLWAACDRLWSKTHN